MARSSSTRPYQPYMDFEIQPKGQEIHPLDLISQPKGLDLVTPSWNLGPDISPDLENWRIDKNGKYKGRPCVEILGSALGQYSTGATIFKTVEGIEYPVQWSLAGVRYYNSGWIALTGPTLDMSPDFIVSSVPWGNNLLFTDGKSGIYKIDFVTGTYSLITGSPICRYVTAFGGRVVASHITGGVDNLATRIQWSVKDDSDDWTGDGSGYEDLFSPPGGVVDTQLGMFPINDKQALAIRYSSVWLVELTGNFDAPFEFGMLFKLRCDSPYTIQMIPGGVVLVGRDGIFKISPSGPEKIGDLVFDSMLGSNPALHIATATYSSYWNEYLVHIPAGIRESTSLVYRINLGTGIVTRDRYNMQIKQLVNTSYQLGSTIDSLSGTIDSLSGLIDFYGRSPFKNGVFMVSAGSLGYVLVDGTGSDDYDDSANSAALSAYVVLPTVFDLVDTDSVIVQGLIVDLHDSVPATAKTLTVETTDDYGTSTLLSAVLGTASSTTNRLVKRIQSSKFQRNGAKVKITLTNPHTVTISKVVAMLQHSVGDIQ